MRFRIRHSYERYAERLQNSPGQLVAAATEWPDKREKDELIEENPTWTYRQEPPWYEKC